MPQVNRKLSAEELERLLSKLKLEHDALRAHCETLEEKLAGFTQVRALLALPRALLAYLLY